MKRGLIILLIIGIVFIIACKTPSEPSTEIECPEKVCPTVTCPECESCPEQEVKEITKYVCPDEKIVDNKDDCFKKKDLKFTPITTNEEGTLIELVEAKPGCQGIFNGGQVYFKIGAISDAINFQVRQDGAYETVYTAPSIINKYIDFAICDECTAGEFQLKSGTQYLFRIEFDLTSTYGRIEYSNEHVIDTETDSDYTIKECSS